MFTRFLLVMLVIGAVSIGCSSGPENFQTAGAPGSTKQVAPGSEVAKLRDAAAKAGRLGSRPGPH